MANNGTPFTNNKYDLGITGTTPYDRSTVDDIFRNAHHSHTEYACLICGRTAQYRLIPKHAYLNTAEIQDRGYICGICLNTNNNIKGTDYGIRELNTP